MAGIKDYSPVPASNTALFPEGMAPSAVNDGMRQVQADIREWYNDAEWVIYGDGEGAHEIGYASATSFTVLGGDVTDAYHVGRRVKATGATTGAIYGTISSSSFATDTTVTVSWDSGSLKNEALAIHLGILRAKNVSVPAAAATITGEIRLFGSTNVPSGWLRCDGAAVSRTTYGALFAVIGTDWGDGDGSTTFNLPDLRGRVPIGAGDGGALLTNRTLGQTGGAETHTLTEAEMPSHNHIGTTSTDGNHTHNISGATELAAGNFIETAGAADFRALSTQAAGNHNHTFTTSTKGSDNAHNNMQPFSVVNFIIKT